MTITIKYDPKRRLNIDKFTSFDCPFGEEDVETNELYCFLRPLENEKCVGCMKEGCPIQEVENEEQE